MKKTKKLLSVVLSVLIMLASVPKMYTATDLGNDGVIDGVDCSIIALIMKGRRTVLTVE